MEYKNNDIEQGTNETNSQYLFRLSKEIGDNKKNKKQKNKLLSKLNLFADKLYKECKLHMTLSLYSDEEFDLVCKILTKEIIKRQDAQIEGKECMSGGCFFGFGCCALGGISTTINPILPLIVMPLGFFASASLIGAGFIKWKNNKIAPALERDELKYLENSIKWAKGKREEKKRMNDNTISMRETRRRNIGRQNIRHVNRIYPNNYSNGDCGNSRLN